MISVIYPVNMEYHVDYFADTELSLHPWDKIFLKMRYDPLLYYFLNFLFYVGV